MSHPSIVQDLSSRTSGTEPPVCLRYFGPEVNPDAPAVGVYKNR